MISISLIAGGRDETGGRWRETGTVSFITSSHQSEVMHSVRVRGRWGNCPHNDSENRKNGPLKLLV